MVNHETVMDTLSGDTAGSGADEAGFRARLQGLVERLDAGNVAAFARRSGVPYGTLRKHLSGETEAGRSNLVRYAAAGGVGVGWLASGEALRPAPGGFAEAAAGALLPDELLRIPVHEAELSAGGGRTPWAEAAVDELVLQRRVVDQIFRPRGRLVALRVAGDSMEPTIRDGALAVIELGVERIDRDGQVYALRYDDALLVKRAYLLPGVGIRLRGDNPASPEVTLAPADAERLQVLGRVCGVLNRP